MSLKEPTFSKLRTGNYPTWKGEMTAWLRAHLLWKIVSEKEPLPTPADTSKPTDAETKSIRDWESRSDQAAGMLYLMVEPEQRIHLQGIEEDPVKIWRKLEQVHLIKKAGSRFNAYDDLFSIRKHSDETLQELVNRIESAMQRIKNLRSDAFTLNQLDQELQVMAMLRSLPEEYNHFVSSLLIQEKLEKSTVLEAFQTYQTQQQRRSDADNINAKALAASNQKSASKKFIDKQCNFCNMKGHLESDCFRYKAFKKQAQEEVFQNRSKGKTGAANKAEESLIPVTDIQEFAGNASLKSSTLSPTPTHAWNADTGATSHMTPNGQWLHNYAPYHIPIRLADNTIVYSTGVGSVVFQPIIKGQKQRQLKFSRVLHVPDLSSNLLSVLYLTKQRGFQVLIDHEAMNFIHSGQTLFTAPINNSNAAYLSGYTLDKSHSTSVLSSHSPTSIQSAHFLSTLPVDTSLWHLRFNHHHYAGINKLIKDKLATGITILSNTTPDPICEPCLAGKMHANPFPPSESRTSKPLELVHMDIHGPLPVSTHSGFRYWHIFVDDHSRFWVIYMLKKKSDAFSAIKQFKAWAENVTGYRLLGMRDDKGGEFSSKELENWCLKHGITRQHTVINRPQQNGVAERANRTAGEGIVSMLQQANMPLSFSGEALSAFVHTRNMAPTSANAGATPYQLFYRKKPDVSHLRAWGCTAYVHVQKNKRTSSLGPHMEKAIFIGYPQGFKGWKFYNPVTKRVIISERADFDERYFPGLKKPISEPPLTSLLNSPTASHILSTNNPTSSSSPDDLDLPPLPPAPDSGGDGVSDAPDPSDNKKLPQEPIPDSPSPTISIHSIAGPATPPPPDTPPLALRRIQRIRRPPQRFRQSPVESSESESEPGSLNFTDGNNDSEPDANIQEVEYAHCTHVANVADGSELRTWAQAMKSPYAKEWKAAADEEYAALLRNNTWEIVKLPPGKKPIGSRWVWLIKRRADGTIDRFKARLVAQGFSQKPGLDYVEVFAPTCRMAALRLILAIAAIEDLHIHSIDISNAYLNGDLEEEIYMKQPEGYHAGNPDDVCHLWKGLYGLKQAGRQWNKKLHITLTSMGYQRLQSDYSIYIYVKDGVRLIMPVFVDDITLVSDSQEKIDSTILELQKHFKLRNLGPTTYLLGIQIIRNRSIHSLSLSQHQYIVDILDRFGMADCKPVTTPMEPGIVLTKDMAPSTPEEKADMCKYPYQNAVGALNYLATCTRPDIAYSVSVLARFNSNPGLQHWKAVKHLFRYLQGTKDLKLVYKPDDSNELFTSYCDADHAGDKDTGRSTGAYVIKYGSGAISWSSKLQSLVALSSTEAEYIAGVELGKEMVWLRKILEEFGYSFNGPSSLFTDSQSALAVSKNPEHFGRMKHLDNRFFWLREQVTAQVLNPIFIPTDSMPADVLTKALPRLKVEKFRRMMGVEP